SLSSPAPSPDSPLPPPPPLPHPDVPGGVAAGGGHAYTAARSDRGPSSERSCDDAGGGASGERRAGAYVLSRGAGALSQRPAGGPPAHRALGGGAAPGARSEGHAARRSRGSGSARLLQRRRGAVLGT